jgi:hypothetical protein
VGDVAAGTAQSSIAIARAYPGVSVDAIDVDAASVERARAPTRLPPDSTDGCIRSYRMPAGEASVAHTT